MIASEGLPSRLECYADGFPKPRVSWSRPYNGILTTGGQFYRYLNGEEVAKFFLIEYTD